MSRRMFDRNTLTLLLCLLSCVIRHATAGSFHMEPWQPIAPTRMDTWEVTAYRRGAPGISWDSVPSSSVIQTSLVASKGRVRRLITPRSNGGGLWRFLEEVVKGYTVGFCLGFSSGTIFGVPDLLFRPAVAASQSSGTAELKGRLARAASSSMSWAFTVGEIAATYKGCQHVVRNIRYPNDDGWNEVYGGMAAGAVFSRSQGLAGITQSALLWGFVVYVCNTDKVRRGFQKVEERLEFLN